MREGLQGLRVAGDTHGAARTALGGEDKGIVGEEARVLAVEVAEALTQTLGDERRHPLMQGAAARTGEVTARRQVGGAFAANEVRKTLRRSYSRCAAVDVCQVLYELL